MNASCLFAAGEGCRYWGISTPLNPWILPGPPEAPKGLCQTYLTLASKPSATIPSRDSLSARSLSTLGMWQTKTSQLCLERIQKISRTSLVRTGFLLCPFAHTETETWLSVWMKTLAPFQR